jgi:hypothetical protein
VKNGINRIEKVVRCGRESLADEGEKMSEDNNK